MTLSYVAIHFTSPNFQTTREIGERNMEEEQSTFDGASGGQQYIEAEGVHTGPQPKRNRGESHELCFLFFK
jgi:hypothetical protein